MALFANPAEMQRVAEHVAAAEQRTAGEIVVAVARRSAEYARERALASLMLTLLCALLVYHFLPQVEEIWLLCAQAPVAALAWWLSGTPVLLRLLVPRALRSAAVRARAQQLFVELGVTETEQRSGVLLFLSESERSVELLADRGIHARVENELWPALVESVVAAIRDGEAAQGLCEAVDAVGAALAEHFPARPGDRNELPDAVARV